MGRLLSDHDLLERDPNSEDLGKAYALLSDSVSEGLADLERIANRGSVMAMLYLGEAYRAKHINDAKGEEWYRVAYENDSATGLYRLGRIYIERKNYTAAERIFSDGVSRNDGPSMYWLALLYLINPSQHPRVSESKRLFENAIAHGQVFAKRNLGRLLITGRYGIGRNLLKGIALYIGGTIDAIRVKLADPHSAKLR